MGFAPLLNEIFQPFFVGFLLLFDCMPPLLLRDSLFEFNHLSNSVTDQDDLFHLLGCLCVISGYFRFCIVLGQGNNSAALSLVEYVVGICGAKLCFGRIVVIRNLNALKKLEYIEDTLLLCCCSAFCV